MLFKCGLLEALLGYPVSGSAQREATSDAESHAAVSSHPKMRISTSGHMCGLELCCVATHVGASRELAGAALAVAEMLLRLLHHQRKISENQKEQEEGKKSKSSTCTGHNNRSGGITGKLQIGDIVIAAGSVSQVCLLRSSLCWSRVNNKDKRRGLVVADNADGTFLVRQNNNFDHFVSCNASLMKRFIRFHCSCPGRVD